MKKVYGKPYAYVETFEVSQHIASCEFNYRGHKDPTQNTCYAVGSDPDYGNQTIFLIEGSCEKVVEDYCNYNAADGNTPVSTSY